MEGVEPYQNERGNYYWKTSVNTDNFMTDWKPEGRWLLTSDVQDKYPRKAYYNLKSYNHEKVDNNPNAEWYTAYPAYDGFDYTGEYMCHSYGSSGIAERGNTPADLKLVIKFDTYSIVLYPDKDEGYKDRGLYAPEQCEVQYADSEEVFNKWNDFPKSKKADWLGTD